MIITSHTKRTAICRNRINGGEIMNLVTKILNSAALASAKNSETNCAIIFFDEPKMPASMIK